MEQKFTQDINPEAEKSAEQTEIPAENVDDPSAPAAKKESSLDKITAFFGVKKPKEIALGTPEEEYGKRLVKFNDFYFQFVASLGIIIALSLLVTVYVYLWAGFAVIFFVCFLYVNFTGDEIFKTLGIRYTGIIGGLKINRAVAKYGPVYYLPARLMWLDVTELADGAFCSAKNENLETVYLPDTLERIGENVFETCGALKTIYFKGSEEEWQKIESKSDFSSLEIVYNATYPALPKKKNPIAKKSVKK